MLVTELSRWGRSSDLARGVSVFAQTGLSFDLATPEGKLMLTIMAGLAEFERDLIRQRVKSGLDAARAKGVKLGRQIGQRPSDKKAGKVHAHRRRHVDPRHRPTPAAVDSDGAADPQARDRRRANFDKPIDDGIPFYVDGGP